MAGSTVESIVSLDHPASARSLRRRRRLHRVTFGALALVVGLAVADGLDLVDVYGVDVSSVQATGPQGHLLEVDHPAVTRAALASPFRVRVTHADGFDEPITLAISRPWIEIWDENGMYPSPSAEPR